MFGGHTMGTGSSCREHPVVPCCRVWTGEVHAYRCDDGDVFEPLGCCSVLPL